MRIENLEPYDMIFDDTFMVLSIRYSYDDVVIEGIPANGRTKEQILKDRGLWRD